MHKKKKILALNGSASGNSSNLALVHHIMGAMGEAYDFFVMDDLTILPHFRTELTDRNIPKQIVEFRNAVSKADGVLICTPEYVFSIPSGLKNAIEWCVSTTVFSKKAVGLITASANGTKGHEELKLIMKTIEASFTDSATLLIQGIKGKIGHEGKVIDGKTKSDINKFIESFIGLIEKIPQRN